MSISTPTTTWVVHSDTLFPKPQELRLIKGWNIHKRTKDNKPKKRTEDRATTHEKDCRNTYT